MEKQKTLVSLLCKNGSSLSGALVAEDTRAAKKTDPDLFPLVDRCLGGRDRNRCSKPDGGTVEYAGW